MQQRVLQLVDGGEPAPTDIDELVCGLLDCVKLLNKRSLLLHWRECDDDLSQGTEAYPSTERLLAFGRRVCGVAQPVVVLQSTASAMSVTLQGAHTDVRACLARVGYRIPYPQDMKTTLDLNDQLLADAKSLAAQQRTSLTRLIEEGLQLRLRAKAAGPLRARAQLPVLKGRGGLVAGIDARSNKALLEAMGDDA